MTNQHTYQQGKKVCKVTALRYYQCCSLRFLLATAKLLPPPNLRFHKTILNGRGHVFCVCFDFSRLFFSLRLFHNPAVNNHNPEILLCHHHHHHQKNNYTGQLLTAPELSKNKCWNYQLECSAVRMRTLPSSFFYIQRSSFCFVWH